MTDTTDRNRDEAPLGKKLEDLYALIEGIEIAMFTTRRPTGTWCPVRWPPRRRRREAISGS